MSIFRPEVTGNTRNKLHGDINLALPTSWKTIGWLMSAFMAALICFLCLATYARVETVPGRIIKAGGMATIFPAHPGVVSDVHVREGQTVDAGALLVTIRSNERDAEGRGTHERMAAALSTQEGHLTAQARAVISTSTSEKHKLQSELSALEVELASLHKQVQYQERLIAFADEEFERLKPAAQSGIISKHDLLSREETTVLRRQQMASLHQATTAKQAEMVRLRRDIAQLDTELQAQLASLDAARAELDVEVARNDVQRAATLVAPVAGRVTALTAHDGQVVDESNALMIVVPRRTPLQAELRVPSRSVGFLRDGQQVRLALDAFEYQRYGTVSATITSVSSAPIRTPGDGEEPAYLVIAKLDETSDGVIRQAMLRPGMQLNARVVTSRQTLMEWLFEPLSAVRER